MDALHGVNLSQRRVTLVTLTIISGTISLSNAAATAVPWSGGGEAPGTYPDVKWSEDGQLLCGATKNRVDIYACA